MNADDVSVVVVGGIPTGRLTAAQWVDLMVSDWREKRGPKVVTAINGQALSMFASNAQFRDAVSAMDYIAADGMSVVNGSKLYTDKPLPERIATTDWFHDAARAAVEHGISFYMLGATPEANAQAVARTKALYPDLKIAGSRDGYFKDEDIPAIAAEIAASGADILWIGMGNPRQVTVAHTLKALLPNVTWIYTCGGLFDWLAGNNPRAPKLIQDIGMEWAWRTMLEPRRLFWRYLTTNVHATWLMASRSEGKGKVAA